MNFIYFFLGAAAMLLFFVAYEMGKHEVKKQQQRHQTITKMVSPTDEDEHELQLQRERAKAINKDFQKMMSYSLEDAMKSEKVVD